jgi:hypothetical protein
MAILKGPGEPKSYDGMYPAIPHLELYAIPLYTYTFLE